MVAAHLDLEAAQAVARDGGLEGRRQVVAGRHGVLALGERIAEPHRMPNGDARQRPGGQELPRLAAGQLRMQRLQADAEGVRPHRLRERKAPGAAVRVDQRPLHERHAEGREQRREAGIASRTLLLVNTLPEVEDGFVRSDALGGRARALDHADHLANVLRVRRLRDSS